MVEMKLVYVYYTADWLPYEGFSATEIRGAYSNVTEALLAAGLPEDTDIPSVNYQICRTDYWGCAGGTDHVVACVEIKE